MKALNMDELNLPTSSAEEMAGLPAGENSIEIQKITNPEELELIRIGADADESASQLHVYHVTNPQVSDAPFVMVVDNDGDSDDGIILTATAEMSSSKDYKPEDCQDRLLDIVEKVFSPLVSDTQDEVDSSSELAKDKLLMVDDTSVIPSGDDSSSIDLDVTKESLEDSDKVEIKLPEVSLDMILDKFFGKDVDYEHTSSGDSILVNIEDEDKVKKILDTITKKGELLENSEASHFVVENPDDLQLKVVTKENLLKMFKSNPLIKNTKYIESLTDEQLFENLIKENEDLTNSLTVASEENPASEDTPIQDSEEDDQEVVINKNKDGSVHIQGSVYGLLVAFLNEETANEIMDDMKKSNLSLDDSLPTIKVENLAKKLIDFVNLKESEEGKPLIDVNMISPDFVEKDTTGDAYGDRTPQPQDFFQQEDGVKSEDKKDTEDDKEQK